MPILSDASGAGYSDGSRLAADDEDFAGFRPVPMIDLTAKLVSPWPLPAVAPYRPLRKGP